MHGRLYSPLRPTSVWYLYPSVLALFLNSQKDPGFCKPSGKMLKFWHGGNLTVSLCVSPNSRGYDSSLCSKLSSS